MPGVFQLNNLKSILFLGAISTAVLTLDLSSTVPRSDLLASAANQPYATPSDSYVISLPSDSHFISLPSLSRFSNSPVHISSTPTIEPSAPSTLGNLVRPTSVPTLQSLLLESSKPLITRITKAPFSSVLTSSIPILQSATPSFIPPVITVGSSTSQTIPTCTPTTFEPSIEPTIEPIGAPTTYAPSACPTSNFLFFDCTVNGNIGHKFSFSQTTQSGIITYLNSTAFLKNGTSASLYVDPRNGLGVVGSSLSKDLIYANNYVEFDMKEYQGRVLKAFFSVSKQPCVSVYGSITGGSPINLQKLLFRGSVHNFTHTIHAYRYLSFTGSNCFNSSFTGAYMIKNIEIYCLQPTMLPTSVPSISPAYTPSVTSTAPTLSPLACITYQWLFYKCAVNGDVGHSFSFSSYQNDPTLPLPATGFQSNGSATSLFVDPRNGLGVVDTKVPKNLISVTNYVEFDLIEYLGQGKTLKAYFSASTQLPAVTVFGSYAAGGPLTVKSKTLLFRGAITNFTYAIERYRYLIFTSTECFNKSFAGAYMIKKVDIYCFLPSTLQPSSAPSSFPSNFPSIVPSVHPSVIPRTNPTLMPSLKPTAPTLSPLICVIYEWLFFQCAVNGDIGHSFSFVSNQNNSALLPASGFFSNGSAISLFVNPRIGLGVVDPKVPKNLIFVTNYVEFDLSEYLGQGKTLKAKFVAASTQVPSVTVLGSHTSGGPLTGKHKQLLFRGAITNFTYVINGYRYLTFTGTECFNSTFAGAYTIKEVDIFCFLPSTLQPSSVPSTSPSQRPSALPSITPSVIPLSPPSVVPLTALSDKPSISPSVAPSAVPSTAPSSRPTNFQSMPPTASPSSAPIGSQHPSVSPIVSPSTVPSQHPSALPSSAPSVIPSPAPSVVPSISPSVTPSSTPSVAPSMVPSTAPSGQPTNFPSTSPTASPSSAPIGSQHPSVSPSVSPSTAPSQHPSALPSSAPSVIPSPAPSIPPSLQPSPTPSSQPSITPSHAPSKLVTFAPNVSPTEFCQIYFNLTGTGGSLGTNYSFVSALAAIHTLPSYGFRSDGVPVPLYQNSQGVGITENPSDLYHIDINHYVQFDFSQYQTSQNSIKFTFSGSVVSFSIYGSNQLGGELANSTLIASGMSTSFSYVDVDYKYLLITSNNWDGCFYVKYVEICLPTASPSTAPNLAPNGSRHPSVLPSVSPSTAPSQHPSVAPSTSPSVQPSIVPSDEPSMTPSVKPSTSPSLAPAVFPSTSPTRQPTRSPSLLPTASPSLSPVGSQHPIVSPSTTPSVQPSTAPSIPPSLQPSPTPSSQPSITPSHAPSKLVTFAPLSIPAGHCQIYFNLTGTGGSLGTNYSFVSAMVAIHTLPSYGFRTDGVPVSLYQNSQGVGIAENPLDLYHIDINHYVQFDVSQYTNLSQSFTLVFSGAVVSFSIYGSNQLGGGLANAALIASGMSTSFTYPDIIYQFLIVTSNNWDGCFYVKYVEFCTQTPTPMTTFPTQIVKSGTSNPTAVPIQPSKQPSLSPFVPPPLTTSGWGNIINYSGVNPCDPTTLINIESYQLGICYLSNKTTSTYNIIALDITAAPEAVVYTLSFSDSTCTNLTNASTNKITLDTCDSSAPQSSVEFVYTLAAPYTIESSTRFVWYNSELSCDGSAYKTISVPFGQCIGGNKYTCAADVLSVLAYPTPNCFGTPVPSTISLPRCLGPDDNSNNGQFEYVSCNSQAMSLPPALPKTSYSTAGWINYFIFTDTTTCDNLTNYYLQSQQLGVCYLSNTTTNVYKTIYTQANIDFPGFVHLISYSYADSTCTQVTKVEQETLPVDQCESQASSSIKISYSLAPEKLSPSVSFAWYNNTSTCNGSIYKYLDVSNGECLGGVSYSCSGDMLFISSYQDNGCKIPQSETSLGLPFCSKVNNDPGGNYQIITCNNALTEVPSLRPSSEPSSFTTEPTSTSARTASLSNELSSVAVNPISQSRHHPRRTTGLDFSVNFLSGLSTPSKFLTFAFLVIVVLIVHTCASNQHKNDTELKFENLNGSASFYEVDVASPKQSSILSRRKLDLMESTFIDMPAPMSAYDTHDTLNDTLNELYGSQQ